MPSKSEIEPARSSKRLVQLRFLILAAAIWHISIVLTLFAIGKFQLLPFHIYPNGLGRSFAADSVAFQEPCVELASKLRTEGVISWATWPAPLHLRPYALPLATVSRWITFNILAIEPVNLFYYLAILVLVFKLGERAFDYRSGLIAAGIVALWPSLLLHTTQLFRDPLLILSVLFLIWSSVELLTTELSRARGLLLGFGAAAAMIISRIVRQPIWYLIMAVAVTAILLLAVRVWRERRVTPGAILFAATLIIVMIVMPQLPGQFRSQQGFQGESIRMGVYDKLQRLPLVDQIAASRGGFNSYFDADGNIAPALDGSLIDSDIRVRTVGDVIRLIPRAIEVGLFAPFPNMWFHSGRQVGGNGRLLAGIETLITYMIECLALFGIWRARRSKPVWLLTVFVVLGVLALGLGVNNIGALYRLRYPFWIVMVILAAGGIDEFRQTLLKVKSRFADLRTAG